MRKQNCCVRKNAQGPFAALGGSPVLPLGLLHFHCVSQSQINEVIVVLDISG